ncbi:hypothetical protein Cch01nite_30270 [Cellulomonas chitinilytica]|uniref:ATP synthase protein I n=1 Tax=Cellulomonas chitinilytica TaxID=398759 RepID=A0A919P5G1_9CELL|nr:hypothetical protein [Cellulomonas chitinilytica]GIG22303.1 hypothetical protein Cch01nite_30270 [Cellulomonas chitinilytica]
MTNAPTPGARPPMSEQAVEAVVRQAFRDMLVLLGVLLVLGVGIGVLVAGAAGAWGALLGVAIALVFSGTTVLSVLATVRSTPARTSAVIMGAWLAKIVVVFVALAVLSRFDFYDRVVLGVVLFAGVLGSAILDLRAVQRGHVPYIEPAPAAGPSDAPSDARSDGADDRPEHADS